MTDEGVTNLVVEDDLLSYTSHDPTTNATFTQRNDGIKMVTRPDGSTITHHADGTRITKFGDCCRVEHPAYGSCLFVDKSVALTLTTGSQILSSANGQKYPIYDKNTNTNITLTEDGWSLDSQSAINFVKSNEKLDKKVILAVKEDGSALKFCHAENVERELEANCYGQKVEIVNGLRSITAIDKVGGFLDLEAENQQNIPEHLWFSNFKYQEETIIPEGLRISQVGGGSHAVVQAKSVKGQKNLNNTAKKYKVRRFSMFTSMDYKKFIEALKELYENNLPKNFSAKESELAAALEQSELIHSVLGKNEEGDSGRSSVDSGVYKKSVAAPDAEEAAELYADAQRPETSNSTVIVATPTAKTVKRLKNYKKEIDQFKVDLNALKDRDVPKYFDSDLGLSWLQTKMVLDSLTDLTAN